PALSPFFSHEPSTTDIYTLSLHDALPIYRRDIACYVPTLAQQQLTQQKNPSILFGVLFKEAVYVKPVHELIEPAVAGAIRVSKEIGRAHSELQSRENLVCRLLLEKKK